MVYLTSLEKDTPVTFTKEETITMVPITLSLDTPVAVKVIDMKMLKN